MKKFYKFIKLLNDFDTKLPEAALEKVTVLSFTLKSYEIIVYNIC